MIVLIGFMGAGKTTVGRLLAPKVGLPFVDVDAVIEARGGASIAEIFRARGEPAFRELEREVAHEVLAGPEAVVALGGGALADPAICSALQRTDVVYLHVSYAEAMRRVGSDASRPMLELHDARELYAQREGVYKMLAGHIVETDGASPHEVALRVGVAVRGPGIATQETQRVVVPLGDRSYEVVVGKELSERLNELLPEFPDAESAFFITHPSLERLGKAAVQSLWERDLKVEVLSIPEGETSKSLSVARELYESLAEHQAHRHDVVISFGGGVVCDVAGFVASTFARGMPLVHVPTSLLAQVDAAIGGKTALNLDRGKNLVGTFYQPRLVVCDVDVLSSLPEEELRSGMAEVAKYGFIADPDLLEYLLATIRIFYGGESKVMAELISRAATIKASFVAADETDRGKRAALNYGHTFAHAMEAVEGLGELRHGEAVALGMMTAAYVSQELGRLDEDAVELHRRVLEALGLPTTAAVNLDDLEAAWTLDKKYRRGVRFVLLRAIGDPEADVEVPRSALMRALARLRA